MIPASGRRTETNEFGAYSLPSLPPGQYNIQIKKKRFQTLVRSGLTLQVAQEAKLDFSLKVGEISQTVTVTTGTEMLAVSGAVSTVVDDHRIVEMPLNGRNVLQLLTLTPGTVAVSESWQANRGSLSYYVDWADGTDFSIKGPAATPPPDAVEEFSVASSSYSAEYGGTGGAVVNLITKSGTNTYHGSARELLKAYRRADGDGGNFNSGYWWQLGPAADNDLRSKITQKPLAPKAD